MTTYQRRTKDISDFRERAIIRQRQSQFGSLGRHRHDWVTHGGQALRKGNEDLLKAVNDAIAEMQKDGTLQALSEKWFGADVTK